MNIPVSFLHERQLKTLGSTGRDGPELLRAFHQDALKENVSYAKKNSAFYKDHLKEVDIETLSGIDDFRRLPFTFPRHLRENDFKFLCVSQDEISRIVTLQTSGTTAAPKRIFFTDSDLNNTIDFFSLVLSQLAGPSEAGLILLPGNTPGSAGDLIKTAMNRVGIRGIAHGLIENFDDALHTLTTHAPSIIIGLPVQVLALGELSRQRDRSCGFVRHVILTSDTVSSAVKSRVGDIFGCKVLDHYGMTETGFGGGIDCFAHQGYHLRETDLYYEIVDPETGRVLPPGQWGEITVTTLKHRGMPLIRYRTGDMSRFFPEICLCKSVFRRMDYIRYRYSQLIPLPNGRRFGMPDLDDIFFTLPGVVDFEAVMASRRGRLFLDIILKTHDTSMARDIDLRENLSRSPVLKKAMDAKVVFPGTCRVEPFKWMDTYTGKRRIKDRNQVFIPAIQKL